MARLDIQRHLEHLTVCPITHQRLRWLDESEILSINARMARRELYHFDTTLAEKPLEAGLITADGAVIYPIIQDIALLLPDFALVLDAARLQGVQVPEYQSSVREFYDSVGWTQSGDGYYEDAHRYEDLRPAAHDYVYDCHLRVNQYLPSGGTYLLDVASGPIQYPTYLTYSDHFEIRVCVDISFRALVDARQHIPAGLFILGNIRNLPFRSDVLDALVSLHTVYHITADQQHAVFDELHRVLKPQGRAVVVYTWGNSSPLNKLSARLTQAQRAVGRALHHLSPGRFGAVPPEDTFFYHPLPVGWFKQQTWGYKFTILCWRSISVDTSKLFFHGWLGKKLLRIIYRWEERYPKFAAPLGQYPMFLIDKA